MQIFNDLEVIIKHLLSSQKPFLKDLLLICSSLQSFSKIKKH